MFFSFNHLVDPFLVSEPSMTGFLGYLRVGYPIHKNMRTLQTTLARYWETTLTHGDLHRNNIIVSVNPPRIIAIIDWGQAGWYPDYWEHCKALYTSFYSGQWRNEWIPDS
jgi:hypothetical protein